MGFEGMYGIGRGAAQVFNSAGIVQNYANQLQQQGLQRQKEQDAYAKELAALNFDGVRQADVPSAQKKWSLVKDKYYELSKTDNDSKKLQIRSEINALKNDMTAFKKRSIDQQKITSDIAKVPLTRNKYEISPDFGERLKLRETLSIEDPRFNEFGIDKFSIQAKPYDVNKNLMELANIAAKEVSTKSVIGKGIDARFKYNEGKQLDEGAFKTAFLDNIASDDHARDTYLKGLEPTPENLNAAAHAAYEIVKDKFVTKERDGGYVDPSGRQLSLYERQRQIGDKYKDSDKKEQEDIYRFQLIDKLLQGDKESTEKVKAYLPSGSKFDLVTSKAGVQGSKGGYKAYRLSIPESVVNGKYYPAVKEDISFAKGDPMNRLNAILNEYTGERVSPSKVNTEGGKPRGKTVEIKPSSVKSDNGQSTQFTIDGKDYNIPSEKVSAFMKQFPKAKRK